MNLGKDNTRSKDVFKNTKLDIQNSIKKLKNKVFKKKNYFENYIQEDEYNEDQFINGKHFNMVI